MKRQQLAALFVCSMIPYFVGNALLPLLPVYVRRLGAEPTLAGVSLGLAFGALVAGSLVTGWLSSRFQTRKGLIILAAAINLPVILAMGQAQSLPVLTALTVVVWFCGGVTTASISILTGMYADPARRGRIFGVIGMTLGLSAVLGGLVGGPVVDRWGYEALFVVVALSQLVQVVAGLLLEDKRAGGVKKAGAPTPNFGGAFWLLAGASCLAYIVHFSAGLGRPLAMNRLGLDATAISSTAAVSGLITLPLPFLIGALSDRLGRRQLLALCYLCVALGTLTLVAATHLWHFWVSTALFAVLSTTLSVGSALVMDIVPPEATDAALARFSASPWLGGVIGYLSGGFVIQALGFQGAFLAQTALPLLSIVCVLAIVQVVRRPQPAASTAA